MKVILTDLLVFEFFNAGGIVILKDGKTVTDPNEFIELPDDETTECHGKIGINNYVYDNKKNKFRYADMTQFLSPRDPYHIKNVNFSCIDENDVRWDAMKQQRLERGFDSSECWNLDSTIARFIIPRLEVFIGDHAGYPANMTSEQWDNILNQILEAFKLYMDEDAFFNLTQEERDKRGKKIDKGLKLFAKHFSGLWW